MQEMPCYWCKTQVNVLAMCMASASEFVLHLWSSIIISNVCIIIIIIIIIIIYIVYYLK